ncbi:MAG: hypothetical protein BGO70_01140 [Bacteroidetes bacterium 43-93]|nr:MAG: hypothetical protein BGO70_01140 [Bacteroidetes bacterium 43-93]
MRNIENMNKMSEILFKYAKLANRSVLQKLFKQYPEENAVIALNNLLASKPIESVTEQDVQEIEQKYRVNLQREFHLNLEEFYAVYFNHYLRHGCIDTDAKKVLSNLRRILRLSEDSIRTLQIKIGERVYRQKHEEAVADGTFTNEKKISLNTLAMDIGLPDDISRKISEEVRIACIKKFVAEIVEDQRLSPQEDRKLQQMAKNLEVDLSYTPETKQQLNKLRLYWALENETLPEVKTSISLYKNEICHLIIPGVAWCEMRTVRTHVSTVGYSTSIRIAKGIYLRSTSHKPRSYSTEQLKQLDRGTLYLTSKRILVTGTHKSYNIRLEKILEFDPYKDGIEIRKDAGRNVFLMFSEQLDIICIMLGRLLEG